MKHSAEGHLIRWLLHNLDKYHLAISGFTLLGVIVVGMVIAGLPNRYGTTPYQPAVTKRATPPKAVVKAPLVTAAGDPAEKMVEPNNSDGEIAYIQSAPYPAYNVLLTDDEASAATQITSSDTQGETLTNKRRHQLGSSGTFFGSRSNRFSKTKTSRGRPLPGGSPHTQPGLGGGAPGLPSAPHVTGAAPESNSPGPGKDATPPSAPGNDPAPSVQKTAGPPHTQPGLGGGAPGLPSAPHVTGAAPESNSPGPGKDATPPSAPGNDPAPSAQKTAGPFVADNPTGFPAPANNTPSHQPVGLPPELNDPQIGAVPGPGDDWLSPGIINVDGDFNLGGRTLLFEIMGTNPDEAYDQLVVNGDAILGSGDVVFAFINDYVPNLSDIFNLILADQILVDLQKVNFYYGLFDQDYPLNAPRNFEDYYSLNYSDGVEDEIKLLNGIETGVGELSFNDLLSISYMNLNQPMEDKIPGPDADINSLEIPAIPEPTTLALMGLGLAGIGYRWHRNKIAA